MLVILNGALANIIYIINKIDHNELPEGTASRPAIFSEHFTSDFINSVVYMYLLSNGEYDFDNFGARDHQGDESTKIVLWLLFFGATFLLQIVFMNMLVALMSDKYNEINEKKP